MDRTRRNGHCALSSAWRVVRLLVLLSGVATLYVEGIGLDPVAVSLIIVIASMSLIWVVERSGDFVLWSAYVLGFVLFAHLRALADQTFFSARYEYVIEFDRLMFLGEVPTVWLQERLYEPGNASIRDFVLITIYGSYFVVPHLFAAVLWIWRRTEFPLYVFAVLGMYYVSLLGFFLVPTAPPWLAATQGHLPNIHRIVQETITDVEPGAYERGHQVVGVNDVAAVPSLHFAATLLVVLVLWRILPDTRVFGALYAALMGLALVYLGEHYVTDIVIGGVVAAGAWWASNRWAERWFCAIAPHDGARARPSPCPRPTEREP